MKSVNSHESEINSFNLTLQAEETIKEEFKEEDVIYTIEEITNEYSTNKYPVLVQMIYELFVIVNRNKEYIINYYYKIDKGSTLKYSLKEIINVNDLDKTSRIFTFLKNYASYNDDKKLKSIIIRKKIE